MSEDPRKPEPNQRPLPALCNECACQLVCPGAYLRCAWVPDAPATPTTTKGTP